MIIRWLSLLTVTVAVLAASTGTALAQRSRKEKKKEPEKQEAPKAEAEAEPEKISSGGSLKIAVIDLARAFNDYNKKKDQDVTLEKLRSQIQKQINERETSLQKLEQELEVLNGDEKLKKKAEFDDKKAEFTAFYRVNQKDLQDKQSELWKTIYSEIIDEVKRLSARDGYDVIFKVDENEVKGSNLEQILLRVDMMKILYHSPKVDLTDEILNLLNEKYKKVKDSKESSS